MEKGLNTMIWQVWVTRIILAAALLGLSVIDGFAGDAEKSEPMPGKELAMARDKGNCLACHAIDDGVLPGNLGPPLISMRLRFPDKEALRQQLWDATERNPNSRMPPFGKYGILDEEQIDSIVDYLYSL